MILKKDFEAAAASYDSAAVLAREVGRRMEKRLGWVRIAPRRMADIGCATGEGIHGLMRRYPAALPLAIDIAHPMLRATVVRFGIWNRLRGHIPRCVTADVRTLPMADSCLDLVWSNLMLHWLPDVRPAFVELHRVLAGGGLLHFSMLGPDTLKALRVLGAPIPAFPDMHDIGDALLAAGFADPVMEMELLTLAYRNPRDFLADQRRLGVRDALLGRLPWRHWRALLGAWPTEGGLFPAHFEIVYGHAWKPAQRPAAKATPVRWHKRMGF